MNRITDLVWKARIWKDTRGQDMIEYALMAGFVALAAADTHRHRITDDISTVFSKIDRLAHSAPEVSARSRVPRYEEIQHSQAAPQCAAFTDSSSPIKLPQSDRFPSASKAAAEALLTLPESDSP